MPPSSNAMRARILDASWVRGLSESQLTRVDRETQVVHFVKGSVVCREGVPALHWVGVLDGMVKVDSMTPEGRVTTFISASSGGWLGEGSLLKREARHYEVVTLRDSWIALMPLQTFDWLYETSLGFNHFLVHQLNARLGSAILSRSIRWIDSRPSSSRAWRAVPSQWMAANSAARTAMVPGSGA